MRIKLVFATLLLVLVSSCSALRSNQFEVTNKTDRELTGVEVIFSDAGIRKGSLRPGETLSFRPSPSRDGRIAISYVVNGGKVDHELGYVAPPFSMRCEFQIVSGGVQGGCD